MVRRIVGLSLAAFMLHLNVERADLACAAHAQHASAAAAHTSRAHHSMPTPGEHARTHRDGCETPAQPDCCQALATCSIALGIVADRSAAAPMTWHDGVRAVAQRVPLSRVTAPEPPPPKA
jgi:hypothetical protein